MGPVSTMPSASTSGFLGASLGVVHPACTAWMSPIMRSCRFSAFSFAKPLSREYCSNTVRWFKYCFRFKHRERVQALRRSYWRTATKVIAWLVHLHGRQCEFPSFAERSSSRQMALGCACKSSMKKLTAAILKSNGGFNLRLLCMLGSEMHQGADCRASQCVMPTFSPPFFFSPFFMQAVVFSLCWQVGLRFGTAC